MSVLSFILGSTEAIVNQIEDIQSEKGGNVSIAVIFDAARETFRNKIYPNYKANRGDAPEDFIIGSWWNHSIVKYAVQISTGSGRIIKQNVSFVGKKLLKLITKNILL